MLKNSGVAITVCLLTFFGMPAGALEAPHVLHLCSPEERVLFACETGKQLASVCASAHFSARTGYIQFRYGTSDEVEIEWPEERVTRHHATKGNLFYANTIGTYLRFRKNRGSFVVFSVSGKSSGLVIEQDAKILKKQVCQKSAMTEIGDLPIPTSEIIAVSGIAEK